MSYCSAMAAMGAWKIGSVVTSATTRPPRWTRGVFFFRDSMYACPLRAAMLVVLSVRVLPGGLDDRCPPVDLGLQMRAQRVRPRAVGGDGLAAELGEARLHLRIGERGL